MKRKPYRPACNVCGRLLAKSPHEVRIQRIGGRWYRLCATLACYEDARRRATAEARRIGAQRRLALDGQEELL